MFNFSSKVREELREELKSECMQRIRLVADELAALLFKNIEKVVKMINELLFNMVEVRKVMIDSGDKNKNETIVRKSIHALIQRMGIPARGLFLSMHRCSSRKIVLVMYTSDLIILDNFVENGKIKSRGIVPFIANGKHGNFQLSSPFGETSVILQ